MKELLLEPIKHQSKRSQKQLLESQNSEGFWAEMIDARLTIEYAGCPCCGGVLAIHAGIVIAAPRPAIVLISARKNVGVLFFPQRVTLSFPLRK